MKASVVLPGRRLWSAAFLITVFAGLLPCAVAAQFSEWWLPTEARHGSEANIVAVWDGRVPLAGLQITLSDGARLHTAKVLRYGREPVACSSYEADGMWHAILDDARSGPLEIVLTVTMPTGGFDTRLRVIPLQAEEAKLSPLFAYERSGSVQLVSGRTYDDSWGLRFDGDEPPLILSREAVPRLSHDAPFEIAFWMRTTGLDQTILSTWNGQEDTPYPLEIEIGPAGRLFVYRGRPGLHESISTRRPVADGAWHEIRLSFDGLRTTLFVDNREVDALPADAATPMRVAEVAIGGRPSEGERYERAFIGNLEDLRIWSADDALTHGGTSLALTLEDGFPEAFLDRTSGTPEVVRSDRVRASAPTQLSGALDRNEVTLSWKTSASPGGILLIERSADGVDFLAVGEIDLESEDNREVRDFQFTDTNPGSGVRYYRVIHELPDGRRLHSRTLKFGLTELHDDGVVLLGNFPNPFRTSTTIAYRLNEPKDVVLSIWDVSGQQIETLVNELRPDGYHEVVFDAADLPSGIYFLRLQTPTKTVSHKTILTR
ncbi:MAG: LamG-like jellyroll fold domain-containing protein [Bacteroidota bacterium]